MSLHHFCKLQCIAHTRYVACNKKLLSVGWFDKRVKTVHVSAGLRENDKTKITKRSVEDDDIHAAIAGTKIAFREERTPWVGFNPFRESVPADWMSYLSRNTDWETIIEDKIQSWQMSQLRGMQE